jgi:phasin family protein
MAKDNTSPFAFSPFDMTKMMPDMKMPGFDMNVMVEAQRRTAEALTEMSQKTMMNMQAVMQRQSEMVRENMKETSGFFNQVMTAGTPEEKIACQTEFAKASLERAVSNGREIVDMMTRTNQETAELISAQMGETMNNVRNVCKRS